MKTRVVEMEIKEQPVTKVKREELGEIIKEGLSAWKLGQFYGAFSKEDREKIDEALADLSLEKTGEPSRFPGKEKLDGKSTMVKVEGEIDKTTKKSRTWVEFIPIEIIDPIVPSPSPNNTKNVEGPKL